MNWWMERMCWARACGAAPRAAHVSHKRIDGFCKTRHLRRDRQISDQRHLRRRLLHKPKGWHYHMTSGGQFKLRNGIGIPWTRGKSSIRPNVSKCPAKPAVRKTPPVAWSRVGAWDLAERQGEVGEIGKGQDELDTRFSAGVVRGGTAERDLDSVGASTNADARGRKIS
jgi:hypothetical protein